MAHGARAAVFLDKDGTLVDDVPYNVDPDRIVLARGAYAGTAALHRAGYALVVVTNQSGVARGLFGEDALVGVEAKLRALLAPTPIAGFYFCPHGPDDGCDCRKPLPGMLLRAAAELDIDLRASWMIGDILNDVEAGARAGCRTVLVDNGGETEWVGGPHRTPTLRVPDMGTAVTAILEGDHADARAA